MPRSPGITTVPASEVQVALSGAQPAPVRACLRPSREPIGYANRVIFMRLVFLRAGSFRREGSSMTGCLDSTLHCIQHRLSIASDSSSCNKVQELSFQRFRRVVVANLISTRVAESPTR